MSRTNARFEAKTPFTDAYFHLSAYDFALTSGTATITKNAKGDFSFNVGASQACVFVCPLHSLLFRTGMQPFLQEQFGTAAGVAGPTSVANTTDPDANVTPPYFPPFTKATMPVISGPEAGYVPKGIQINDVTLHYQITTNPLSTHTAGLSKTVYPTPGTPAALTITDVIANAANGLATAANANPQSTKISVATPAFLVSDLSCLDLEVDATTPAGGAYRLYGATIHVSFNYN